MAAAAFSCSLNHQTSSLIHIPTIYLFSLLLCIPKLPFLPMDALGSPSDLHIVPSPQGRSGGWVGAQRYTSRASSPSEQVWFQEATAGAAFWSDQVHSEGPLSEGQVTLWSHARSLHEAASMARSSRKSYFLEQLHSPSQRWVGGEQLASPLPPVKHPGHLPPLPSHLSLPPSISPPNPFLLGLHYACVLAIKFPLSVVILKEVF